MTDAHGQKSTSLVLTAEDTRALSHAERAKTLVCAERTGTLSTLNDEGFPHGSYITYAIDAGDPIFLVSKLASHTQNLFVHSKTSLLVHEHGASDPLANGRVTLLGHCRHIESPKKEREIYLAAQPQASYYVDFKDFSFWRLSVESIRYIGGYGRMSWIETAAWAQAEIDPIAPFAKGIIEHMNTDHNAALVDYANAFTSAKTTTEALMVGIDRYGFDLSVMTTEGARPARIAFDEEIASAKGARTNLVALAKVAREKTS